ncbi:DEAD/DEAH box helicase [Ferrimonas lipolytica]|uniref:DEAD/DEAH box helicase n=1 Tax=Ferrimonas lipolytica TaxID=2724191 RepID=A0A6H1UK47_9GAMM|nr:DEAD/DEAH box helicase [Ferrimonas lipolytica]QIZ78596.1 DEAD/DEAH box helicase [Ferrimonas lipolytica]
MRRLFEKNTFARGEALFERGKVIYCEVEQEGRRVFGEVAGTYSRDYEVTVAFSKTGLTSECSCPVANRCKHAAALLLAALEQQGSSDTLYQMWLNRVEQVLNPPKWAASDGPELEKLLAVRLLHQNSERSHQAVVVKTGYRRRLKNGGLSKVVDRSPREMLATYRDDMALNAFDRETLQLLETGTEPYSHGPRFFHSGLHQLALKRLCERKQLYWDQSLTPLSLAGVRKLNFHWQQEEANQTLELQLDGCRNWQVLPFRHPWYVDCENNQTGPIDTPLSSELLYQLFSLPGLSADSAKHFSANVLGQFSTQQIELPGERAEQELIAPLKPQLHLWRRDGSYVAAFSFGYDDVRISPIVLRKPELRLFETDRGTLWVQRDTFNEQEAFVQLEQFGLAVCPGAEDLVALLLQAEVENPRAFWQQWLGQWRDVLEQQGWDITLADDLHLEPVKIAGFALNIEQHDRWFDLGLSIELEGEAVSLVPLLLKWLASNSDWREPRQDLLLERTDGAPLQIGYQALRPIIAVLAELADTTPRETVKLNQHQITLLPEDGPNSRWHGGEELQQLAECLHDFDGIEAVTPPAGLQATLRDYQQQGLNWLSFLHQYGFGGVLADDMGLGKTIQTLAHLQRLKEHGKLSKPSLLICPTSLVGNWRRECAKFTPELNVLVLHGSRRQDDFNRIEQADLVITTYPLIHRDIDTMVMHDFSLIVLDEAQSIKNPSAKATLAIKDLKGEQCIGLTGTPMENHLGELWSLFDFALPGFLGSQGHFNRHYRKPIEQCGDEVMQQWLLRKIGPFLLRRTKDQVATELPPKTEIIKRVMLPPAQRTLYESVRATMEAKVRKLIEQKGLAKSRMEFLDALLKLRQICCDPKLTKLDEAENVEEAAKLDYLMEQLPKMLAEGRRVLLFSQFTQMLSRIEQRLLDEGIDYSILTGQTRNREAAVDAFQSGDVPLFLISLKAGGVGLNLTAADTVIHFDPWWNPAAEQQATDRAYRIGQDKPVFVYKLICEHTVEERVLELQQSKQALADSVYGKEVELATLDDGEQLLALFRDDPHQETRQSV